MRAPQVRTSITQRSMKVAPGRLVRRAWTVASFMMA